jgi:hypothetical protein
MASIVFNTANRRNYSTIAIWLRLNARIETVSAEMNHLTSQVRKRLRGDYVEVKIRAARISKDGHRPLGISKGVMKSTHTDIDCLRRVLVVFEKPPSRAEGCLSAKPTSSLITRAAWPCGPKRTRKSAIYGRRARTETGAGNDNAVGDSYIVRDIIPDRK